MLAYSTASAPFITDAIKPTKYITSSVIYGAKRKQMTFIPRQTIAIAKSLSKQREETSSSFQNQSVLRSPNTTKDTNKSFSNESQLQQQLEKMNEKLQTMDQNLLDLSRQVTSLSLRPRITSIINNSTRNTNLDITNTYYSEQMSQAHLEKGHKFGDCYYFGELNADQLREGYGALYDSLGRIIYCGYWLKDRFHNRGKLYYYDLDRKAGLDFGDIKDQKKINQNRVSYTGEFVLGEIKGLGQMLFHLNEQQQCVFYGRFISGVFHGKGYAVLYKGGLDKKGDCTVSGEWSDGIFIQ